MNVREMEYVQDGEMDNNIHDDFTVAILNTVGHVRQEVCEMECLRGGIM